MGVFDQIAYMLKHSYRLLRDRRKLKKLKRRPLQTVEIRIKMDCEGCARKVRKSVEHMRGVAKVEVEPKKQRLAVIGHVDPNKVLRRVRHRTGKRADFWPFIPFDMVDHPYVEGVYDFKAPLGYVRNAFANPEINSLARASSTELKYVTAFSDENPHSCTVM